MTIDAARRDKLIATYRNGLLNDTLPFWIKHCVDRQHGGFMLSLDRDGTVIDTDKGVWQQGRFTWLLGELYSNFRELCRYRLVRAGQYDKRHDCIVMASTGHDHENMPDRVKIAHTPVEGQKQRSNRVAHSTSDHPHETLGGQLGTQDDCGNPTEHDVAACGKIVDSVMAHNFGKESG